MATYGLLITGFVPKTLEVIRAEIEDSLKAAFGDSIQLGEKTIFGQMVGILSERYALLWELAEAVHKTYDPDAATGASLDGLCALTGTVRNPATSSSIPQLVLAGTAATVVTSGSQASVTGTLENFATVANATLIAATAWILTNTYNIGDFSTNDGGKLYVVTQAGTSAGAGGPTGTGTAIADNTVVWRYVSTDAAAVVVQADAVNTGPIVAATGDVATIETPVSGWNTVINFSDATLGSDIETDEDLRARREQELAQAGTATVDAIRAALLEVTGVTSTTVFQNTSDVTDADGVPPHAIEALIEGGADQDLFDALLANVAAGINASGSTSGTATDDQGTSHAESFSRPTSIRIYVDVTLTYDAALYPADGDAQVELAATSWGDDQLTGKDVVASAIKGAIFKAVPGVLDVSSVKISIAPAPTLETTIAIALRERMDIDSADVVISSSSATP